MIGSRSPDAKGKVEAMKLPRALAAAILAVGGFAHPLAPVAAADDSEKLLTVDHYGTKEG
jgi:hypothetical protein